MKRIHFLTAAAAFLALFTACQHEGDTTIINQVAKEQKTFPVVTETLTSKDFNVVGQTGMQVNLCFRQGKEDIPYICLTPDLLNKCLEKTFTISEINALTNSVTITNTDRSNTKAVFDLTHHTLSFENYDLFFQSPSNVYMDPAAVEEFKKAEDEGVETYLEITTDGTSSIAGQPIALDWSTQDVEVVLCNNNGTYSLALPLQMFNDVFLSPVGDHLVYNGAKVYQSGKIDPDDYYKTSPYSGKARSAAMAELCYNELCLNLDFNYGLKAIHGIDKFPDFDTYFASAGIKNSLKSTDPTIFANALKDVCEFYFGDGHSNYQYNSPYFGIATRPKGNHTSPQGVRYKENTDKYQGARDTVYNNGNLPGYELSSDGKTVIVRFDEFTLNTQALTKAQRKEYGDKLISDDLLKEYVNYKDPETKNVHLYESTYDTVAFIYAVNKTIKDYDAAHANAKIENIVLDMSCNGGGANHSAGFVLAWMLGKCDFAFTNPITGAKWTISYIADVDMNGTAGEAGDTVKDKNLFCLISPCSFSCGNMVPAMLKASDRVTILGVTSSGGSSCVQSSSAADGSIFRMSSKYVMSINKNGSNYDIDKGIDPHYFINDPVKFYEKDTIAALVKNINSGKLISN